MTITDSDKSELMPGAMVSFRWIDGDMYEGRIVSLTASDAVVMLESGRTTTIELSALRARDRRDRLEVKNTSERDVDMLYEQKFHQELARERVTGLLRWWRVIAAGGILIGIILVKFVLWLRFGG